MKKKSNPPNNQDIQDVQDELKDKSSGQGMGLLMRLILVLSVFAGYILVFFEVESSMGGVSAALSIVPVIVASWFFGLSGGLLSAILVFPLNIYLLNLTGQDGWGLMIRGMPGSVSLLIAGVIVGKLRDLRERLKLEIKQSQINTQKFVDRAVELEESQRILEEKTTNLKVQNQELENIKQAMLNLLEDSQELQVELKKEKESVERKVEERTRELKKEEARLVSSIESLPLGYILTDAGGEMIMMNRVVGRIFGYQDDKTLEDHVKEVLELPERCAECIQTKSPSGPHEVTLENKFLRVFLTPVSTGLDVGEIAGVVVLVEDVTASKLLDRAKDEFFAVASHELRTPLTAIRGNTALIQDHYSDRLPNAKVKEMIADIHESSIRLIELVNDFLQVSRLEQKRTVFRKQGMDITSVVSEVIHELESTASDKKLDLKFEKPKKPLPKVVGDQYRARQVIFNLLGNALKYTEEGAVQVLAEKRGDFLQVKVIDTGIGISKPNQKLLFKKFQQAGENFLTQDVTRGTGMGLYISKLLTEGMGGVIFLEDSEPNKGSTFVFKLPIAKPA